MNFADVRKKYPEYNDLSDDDLAKALHGKFYSDMPFDQFASSVGFGKKVEQQRQEPVKRGFFDVPAAISNPTPENIAADPLVRFAVGAGRPVAGLTQLLSRTAQNHPNPLLKILGIATQPGADALARDISKTEKIGKEGMRQQGDEGWNVSGTLGEMMSPVNLGATKYMPAASRAIPRIGQGSGAGALFSLMQPYTKDGDFDTDKLVDAAIGSVAGAGIGATVEAGKYGLHVLRQFMSQAGAKDLSLKYMETILGKDNFAKVVDEIERRTKTIGKNPVSEYKPTTGELVADMPEAGPLLALQLKTSQTAGGPSAQFGRREIENRSAIERAIGSFAKTPEELAEATRRADFRASQNYGPLMNQRVRPESDASLLLRDLQETRGTPWAGGARSDVTRAAPDPITGFSPFGVQPSALLGTTTGKAGALQQWGKAATDDATQTSLSNNWLPVQGMPRVSGRYSPNAEVAAQARSAAQEALQIAGVRGKQADFLQVMLDRLEREGVGARQGLDDMVSRPSMASALAYAQKMATERGYGFPKNAASEFSVQNLHDIKLGLDAQIRAGAVKNQPTSLDNATLASIEGTKRAFLDFFEKKVPEYGKARTQYAQDMVPVNQMTVGQALLSKLSSPTGTETPGSFLRALSDETKLIKTATGQPRMDLGQVLTKDQNAIVSDAGNILERKLASLSPVQKAALPGGGDISKQIGFELPSILSRPVVIANYLLSLAKKGTSPVEQRIDAVNTLWMLDPSKFTEAVRTMNATEQRKVLGLLGQAGIDPVRQGIVSPLVASGLFSGVEE